MKKFYVIAAVLFGIHISSSAQTPFSCSSTSGYVVVSNNMYTIDPVTGASALAGTVVPGGNLNCIGYNLTDNFIWGKIQDAPTLVRVASDFSVTTFSPSGLPFGPYQVGDVSAAGVLYFRTGNGAGTGPTIRVDVNPASPTYLTVLTSVPTSASLAGVADWAFSPIDGNLYGIQGSTLYRIDPVTGTVTNLGTLSAPAGNGAVFMDAAGSLYAAPNAGNILKIPNPHSGGLTVVNVGTAGYPSAGIYDGARCMTATSVPLPLTLTDFSVAREAGSNVLHWATRSQMNVDYFAIERSADSRTWEKIGTLLASGDEKAEATYSFTDEKPLDGTNLYRLKIQDKDGKFVYSPIRRVDVQNTGRNIVNVYPNPASDMLHLVTDWQQVKTVKLIAADGRYINDITTPDWNISGLPAGLYFIKVLCTDGHTEVEKVFISGK